MVYIVYIVKLAKLFLNGRSQAVRLPKEFRLPGEEVHIRREGDTVILEPIRPAGWPEGFWRTVRIADASFERPDQGSAQDRSPLEGEGGP